MQWPWQRAERRESSFTDLLVGIAVAQATGTNVKATATAALETCAGIIARAFAAAEVDAPEEFRTALSPACLALIGRALVRGGQVVLLIEVHGGQVYLFPASDWYVTGDHDPRTWRYRVTVSGPTRLHTLMTVSGEAVLNLRHSIDPARPWEGIGPIASAQLAGKLSAETAAALGDEAGGPRGYLLPTPIGGDEPTIEKLKADLQSLRGSLALVEGMGGAWQGGENTTRTSSDWMPRRIGATPPAGLVAVHEMASREIQAACGVSPVLFDSRPAGTAGREAFRQFLHATVAPLGRIVESELREKLDPSIRLNFDRLFAADVQGRARAWRSLVGAEAVLDPATAARLVGLADDGE